MQIRVSATNELDLISDLHRLAFGQPEGDTIAQLIMDLFDDHTAQPILSLVAEDEEALLGSVIFSKVVIEGAADSVSAFVLAPLAVHREYQGQGVGSLLIKQGLDMLEQQGAHIVLVYGDPEYYTRFGFHTHHKISAPHKLEYPEAWMAIELQTNVLSSVSGTAQCSQTLNDPQHW